MRSLNIGTGVFGLALLLLISVTDAFGQYQNLPPNLTRAPRNADEAAYRQIQIQRTMEAQQRQAMRDAENNARRSVKFPREELPELTEADRKRIKELLTPEKSDVDAYRELLDQDNTGIFKLFPNSNCETKHKIRVDGECSKHVPGGSTYSFRSGGTTPDIHFNDGKLIAEGFFSQILIGDIGNLKLSSLTHMNQELAFFTDFKPATDFEEARKQHQAIVKGIEFEGKTYSNVVVPRMTTTYAMRIVAYRNRDNLTKRMVEDAVALDSPSRNFIKVQDDHRYDMVVAFRIIRRSEDGALTLIWKELSRQKSPVINFDRDEKMVDFKD